MPGAAWFAIGAATAALGVAWPGRLPTMLCGAALLLLAIAWRTGEARRRPPLLPIALGMLMICLREIADVHPPAPVVAMPSGDGPWTGAVVSVSAPRDGSRPVVIRLDGPPAVLVAATLPWYPPVVPTDRVTLTGRIRPPPDGEYGAYLAEISVIGTLRAGSLEVLPPNGTIERSLEGVRRAAADGLTRAMPEPEAGLAAGVLLGLRDHVDRTLAEQFTTAGASHVVAISGWNIAIVASTIGALSGGLRRRRRAILIAIAIVAYVVFVGPSASVVRAGAMAGVALLARELGRPGSAAAALGWAVTCLLLVDTATVFDEGFRLSVLATAGILAWGSTLTSRLAGANPRRARRWVAEILGVSLAAQAATLPIVLSDFGRLSLVSPAVNLVVVPLVPLAMATGALALVVGVLAGIGLPGAVATIVGLPAWAAYAAMVATVRLGAGLPLASLDVLPPWNNAVAVATIVAILVVRRWWDPFFERLQPGRAERARAGAAARAAVARQTRSKAAPARSRLARALPIALVGATLGLGLVVAARPDGIVRVTVLDVGQGDGILIEGGRAGRMVIDGGPDPGRLLIALDERLPPWDRRIDILVLTHPHEDHVAGLALLLQRYRVGRVYEPGMVGAGPGYRAWADIFASGGPPHGRLSTGDRLTLDEIRFRVLWPDANRVPQRPPDGGTSINNVSIVLLGEFGTHRFLLAGDVEEGVDPELLERGVPQVDLLKVAHHGSRTASTRPFLEAAHPRVAIVSAGAGNPYGHPAPSTIERLRALAGHTYRTDTDGSVEVAFDGPAIRVKTSGPRPAPRNATPRPGPTAALAPAGASVVSAFLCGIPTASLVAARPPTAPEAPAIPQVTLGGIGPRGPAGSVASSTAPSPLGRLPDPADGRATTLGYHPRDGEPSGIGDRAGARDRSPRLLLGRRRVRARCRARGVSQRPFALSGRPAGALAPRDRARRTRPPPR